MKRHDWQLRLIHDWSSVCIGGTSLPRLHPLIAKVQTLTPTVQDAHVHIQWYFSFIYWIVRERGDALSIFSDCLWFILESFGPGALKTSCSHECLVTVTLTLDQQNVIFCSSSPNKGLLQIWRNSLEAFLGQTDKGTTKKHNGLLLPILR